MKIMMKSIVIGLTLMMLAGSSTASAYTFEKESFSFGKTTIPYQVSKINHGQAPSAIVMYLHGGSSRGVDGELQMQEAAIATIATYLEQHAIAAYFLVPQCPSGGAWLSLQKNVRALLDKYANLPDTDKDRIYLLGGSMGGTGTWNIVSANPGYFAAAMPCAGNPQNCDAANVAPTAIFTVMGTADALMKMEPVETFVEKLREAGGHVMFEKEEGYSHAQTCTDSYTDDRLAWVFENSKQATGISDAPRLNDKGGMRNDKCYNLSGQRLTQLQRGLNIVNGRKVMVRKATGRRVSGN